MTENKDDMSKGIIYKPNIYKMGGETETAKNKI